ncbi:hypothetical protein SK128_016047 [Halocaridina rubra]|uniref:Uncharacterized protein n=1 Tax=Halocaridina rubra TaxID=373956 RepID=A0AAN8ZR47_HALRR
MTRGVETYDNEEDDSERPDDEQDTVAGPLKPAYAPNPATTAPPPREVPKYSRPHFYRRHIFCRHSTHFEPPFQFTGVGSHNKLPDTFSTTIAPSGNCMSFQPSTPAPSDGDTSLNGEMQYYPWKTNSARATGVMLSRAVRKLEATPPSYLLLPEHPNALPSIPFCRPPPAPPNTAHAQRIDQNSSQYPGIHKVQENQNLFTGNDAKHLSLLLPLVPLPCTFRDQATRILVGDFLPELDSSWDENTKQGLSVSSLGCLGS